MQINNNADKLWVGGRRHWSENYAGTQSLAQLLALKHWVLLLKFDWLVPNQWCPIISNKDFINRRVNLFIIIGALYQLQLIVLSLQIPDFEGREEVIKEQGTNKIIQILRYFIAATFHLAILFFQSIYKYLDVAPNLHVL